MRSIKNIAINAKKSCSLLSLLNSEQKETALLSMASALDRNKNTVLKANKKDVEAARRKGLSEALLARLTLDEAKIQKISDSIRSIAALVDPVGKVHWEKVRPNGLKIKKVSVPIGVILIIYESRPNVTADCMALCLKSGNSVILKGGSEAQASNEAIFKVLSEAAYKTSVPKGAFQFVGVQGRSAVGQLLTLSPWIDLVIPRGGQGLIREVTKLSRIPVIKHYKGVCHVYVDKDADLAKAESILVNAKTQNPSVCNAAECLLVHEGVAGAFLPRVNQALQLKKVEIHADSAAYRLMPGAKKALEKDWGAEFLDYILAVRVVKNLDQALEHIQKYGSNHSDAIVTEDQASAKKFIDSVDSAAVFVNASTRFNDGGEFGMGAEMGISTDKIHARGPMGLEELTSYKYVVLGNGQIRQ